MASRRISCCQMQRESSNAPSPGIGNLNQVACDEISGLAGQTRSRRERSRQANRRATRAAGAEDRATWEQLAHEAEQEKQALRARLDAAQRLVEAQPFNVQEIIEQGETTAQQIDLDEAATRQIVDQQLRDRGWEVDTQKLTYGGGTRPAKGRAMAIAEWPTESGPADYALFVD